MSFMQRIFGRRVEKRDGSWDLLQTFGYPSATGQFVSPQVVEGLAAAYASIQLISQTLGTMPLVTYRKEDRAVVEDSQHPVASLFADAPNPLQTPSEFISSMMATCLTTGFAAAEIVRDGNGRPVELWPLPSGTVSVARVPNSRRIIFEVSDEVGTRRLLPGEVLLIKDRWDSPYVPRSRLDRAREALGGAVATERFASATWKNGARLSGIVSHPEQIGPDAARTLRETLQSIYGGAENAGKIGVLEEGAQWKEMSATPHDAELSEARRLSVVDVCRVFNVPPPMVAALEDATYSNIEAQVRLFATNTIRPWATFWQEAIRRDLFSEAGRRSHEVRFDLDELLRGDMLSRFQAWRIAREIGAVSANEVRESEGWNPRTDAGGNEYFAPANMTQEQTAAPRE